MLKLILQLILFCLLFTVMVRIAVIGGAVNGLYFYPKPVQARAYEIGLSDPDTVLKKRKRFMIPFLLVMLAALLLIIGLWNQVRDFKTAYFQSLLFLEVMNWYDGIVIDRFRAGSRNCCAQPMDRPTWGPPADADSLRDPQTLNQASSQPPLCPDFQSWIRWSLIKKGEKLKKKNKNC